MKFRFIGLGVMTLCATALSFAAETTRPDDKEGADIPGSSQRGMSNIIGEELPKLDTNKDGMVSQSEAKADFTWSKQFKDVDTNGDGMIDSAELVAHSRIDATERQGRSKGGKDSLPTPSY